MEQQMIANGGVQYVPQIAVQYVYLDFDGELTSYNGEILTVDNVEVQDSSLPQERIANILAELNAQYSTKNVIFVTERPTAAEYSTIYIGKTSAFDKYGSFAGLAETIDKGNQIKNDNAFVMLDSSASNEQIISTISHETDHLLGTLDHGGSGLAAYAAHTVIGAGVTSTGLVINTGNSATVIAGGVVNRTSINSHGYLHIYEGGVANSTTVNSHGYLHVSEGGVANNTTVNFSGYMRVSEGGVANNTTVSGSLWLYGVANNAVIYDNMFISSGGKANDVMIEADGFVWVTSNSMVENASVNGSMRIDSDGIANSITILSSGILYVSNGGTATNIIWTPCEGNISVSKGAYVTYANQYSGVYFGSKNQLLSHAQNMTDKEVSGSMYVMTKGVANDTVVTSSGIMFISSGGVANNTEVTEKGVVNISSGGVANDVVVGSNGRLTVETAGTLNHAKVTDKGRVYISNGGIANNIKVDSGGCLYIYSTNNVDNITINSSSYCEIIDGSVTNITWTPFVGEIYTYGAYITFANQHFGVYLGSKNQLHSHTQNMIDKEVVDSMYVMIGGSVKNTIIDSNGQMWVSSGMAENTIVSDGKIQIYNGGVANSTTIKSGSFEICSGGTANNTTVIGANGWMDVLGGGEANNTIIDGGWLNINSGALMNDTTLSNGVMRIYDGAVVKSAVVTGGNMIIFSGGEADKTSVFAHGELGIEAGGVANNTIVNSFTQMKVSSGGTANNVSVARGSVHIFSGGIVNNIVLISGGSLTVQSGGTAYNINGTPFTANIDIHDGAYVTFKNSLSGIYFASNQSHFHAQSMDGKVVSSAIMYVMSDGIANNTIVSSGTMHVYDGGLANNTIVDFPGILNIYSGGIANSTTIDFLGHMNISDGGIVNSITALGGKLQVFSGATVKNISADIDSELCFAVAPSTYIQGTFAGSGFEIKNGMVQDYVINSQGELNIVNGGVANNTVVNGKLTLLKDGNAKACNTLIKSNGLMTVNKNNIASNTTVNSVGRLYVYSGGIICGTLQIEADAIVTAHSESVIDFTVADRKTTDSYLINDLSLLQGTPHYTVTVLADQAEGIYKLAAGASEFNASVILKNTGGDIYGGLSVGKEISAHGVDYSLVKDDAGNLYFQVDNLDFAAPTIQSISMKQESDSYTFTAMVSATDNETAVQDLKYQIKYAATQAGLTAATATSGKSFTLNANAAGKTYYYQVGVTDKEGNTAWSTAQSFTVKDVTKPTLNGSPRAKVNGRSVTISWNAASDNVGVAGYYLAVDGNKHTVSGTSYTINNLSGGNHTYSLTAFDAAGNISAKSADQSFTVIGTANVNFYSPSGWSDSFVLSTVPNTHSGELQISAGKDLYVDWAVRNSGDAVAKNITVSLALDGVTVKTWTTSANINQTVSNLDYRIDSSKLSAGKHQLTLTLNDGKTSISKDKSITVTAPDQGQNSEFKLTGNEYAFVSVPGLTANDFVYTVTTTGERHDYIYTDNKNLIYDAEKTGINSTNPHTVYEMCCWAATATNMYIKAGYGKSGSQTFANEDDLLKYIIEHADTVPCKTVSHNYMDGAFTDIGFEWLFTGNFDVSKCGGSWDISGGGFYKKTIDASNMDQYFLYAQDILGYSNYYNAPAAITNMPGKNLSHDMFLYADQCLRENYSVGLNVSWDVFENTTGRFVGRDGGHAITVYGFTYNQTKDKNNDPGYYTGLIVADSDDDKTKSDPTSVPDRLKVLSVEWNQTYQRYIFENYGEYKYSNGFTQKGVIDGMDFLAPCTENSFAVNGSSGNNEYSWSLERTPSDLTFGCSGNWGQHSFSVGNSKETALAGGKQHLVADKNIYLALELANLAATASSSFVIGVQVYDIYSNVVITKTITVDGFSSNYTSNDIVLDLGKLPLGFYTATVVIDPQETLNESDTDNNVLFAYIGTVHIPSSSAQNTIVENTTMTSHTVASNRYCYVKTNGILDTSTVSANGVLYIQDNGLAKNLTVKEKGQAFVEFGADAQDITIEAKGIVTVEYGNVDGATVNGVLFIDKDAYGKNITVYENGGLNVDYNGSIVNVENHGTIYVVEDGNSRNVINKGTAYMAIGSESPLTPAEAADSYFYDESKQNVVSWGTAQNNFFYDSAQQYVAGKEAVAKNNIFYAGRQGVAKAGCVYDTVLQGQGVTQEIQDGEAYRTTIRNYSEQFVFEQGCVYDTIIETNGRSIIFKDAVSVNATVKNGGFLWAGSASPDYAKFGAGTIKDATIEYGGSLVLEEGATITGTISVAGYLQAKGEVNAAIENITARTPTVEIDLSARSVTDTNAVIDGFDYLIGCNWAVVVNTDQANGTYKLAEDASEFTGSISIGSEAVNYGLAIVNGSDITYNGKKFSLDQIDGNLTLTITGSAVRPELTGNDNGVSWSNISGSDFTVEYSRNDYSNTLQIEVESNAVDTFGLSAGTYQWRVKGDGEFVNGENIVSNNSATPQNFVSDADGNMDVFFSNANGTWGAGYAAEHQGFRNGWTGTREQVMLYGKNKIADVFSGSEDANILVLTDDANGDALFVEDIYTTFGNGAARIAQINEIRAGAGNDIIDMTSQLFAYVGDGVTIYGGLGNDTIWANNGNNTLFGDAGNDRIVGGSGNDFIIGGVGNDSMHGGGGDDIFCFGGDWGNDTVEQLAGGSVTLWFEDGSQNNWNASTLTYTDGTNSVKVSGVDTVTLKFGTDASLPDGCFADAASEKIFEDKNSGMLA